MGKKQTGAKAKGLPVMLSAETVIGLVRKVEQLEKQYKELEIDAQMNFDTLVEHIPKVVNNGLAFKAFTKDGGDGYESVVVPFTSREPFKE